ncbi:class I SAM-dependent methyltransferase [Nonomuraea sp. NPDC049158]|uniref:class I SAM-dependent methyltransferase n=1 Tax=Nonomuraea sp. NPDC049158 TaxID=3155649 RepID=UPI003409DA1E
MKAGESAGRPTGAETYTRKVLFAYDVFVLGVICPLVWRCPRAVMLALYNRNVGARHLDLGPGTGYFLHRCRFPVPDPAITLVDLNTNVLRTAGARLARHEPDIRRADVLAPLDLDGEPYDSVGMNFLLHCLPGGMERKATVFDHVRPHLRPGARVFGSTVLAHGVRHSGPARKLIASFNEDETFHNSGDSLQALHTELGRRFADYRIQTRGSVALFEARMDERAAV